MRLDAWKSCVSDKLSMSESKIERERVKWRAERERRLAGLKRSSRKHKSRQDKRVHSRQPSLSESFKRRGE
jgi:hypothetical protein